MLGCLDVTLLWENDVVEVRRLARETQLTIGNDDEDLFVPLPAGEQSHALLSRPHPGARWTLNALPGMDARVLFDDGVVPLAELTTPEPDGTRRLVLDAPVRAQVSIGAFCLELRPDAAHAAALVPLSIDRPLAHTSLPTSAFMAALVAAFWLTPEPLHAEESETSARRAFAARLVTSPPAYLHKPAAREADGTRVCIRPNKRPREWVPARSDATAAAAADEVLGALSDLGQTGGAGGALADALGDALDGVRVAGAGAGGPLSLRGSGVADGSGRRTHHLGGVLRTGGRAAGATGGAIGTHAERDVRATIVAGEPTGCDATCRDLIRKVVAANQGAVRHCYERALQARPGIGGRVAVRWVMREGNVVSAQVADDPTGVGVGACIVRRMQRWRFPRLEGVQVVTYPWVFRSR